jgi:hypothetical protein
LSFVLLVPLGWLLVVFAEFAPLAAPLLALGLLALGWWVPPLGLACVSFAPPLVFARAPVALALVPLALVFAALPWVV